MSRITRAKGILGVIVVFVCGLAVGATVMHTIDKRRFGQIIARGPAGFKDVVAKHLDAELSLDQQQREKLQTILEQHNRGIMEIMRPQQQRMENLFEQTADRIKEILEPEQRRKFEILREKRKRQLREPFLHGKEAQAPPAPAAEQP